MEEGRAQLLTIVSLSANATYQRTGKQRWKISEAITTNKCVSQQHRAAFVNLQLCPTILTSLNLLVVKKPKLFPLNHPPHMSTQNLEHTLGGEHLCLDFAPSLIG